MRDMERLDGCDPCSDVNRLIDCPYSRFRARSGSRTPRLSASVFWQSIYSPFKCIDEPKNVTQPAKSPQEFALRLRYVPRLYGAPLCSIVISPELCKIMFDAIACCLTAHARHNGVQVSISGFVDRKNPTTDS